MRSLANTARVMADNPMLLRLKELESLKDIAEKIGEVRLLMGADGIDKLLPAGLLMGPRSQKPGMHPCAAVLAALSRSRPGKAERAQKWKPHELLDYGRGPPVIRATRGRPIAQLKLQGVPE